MLFNRKSPITGRINSMEIDVSDAQLELWRSGVLIQTAMPNVPPGAREFILSGITPDEWQLLFYEKGAYKEEEE